MQQGFSVALQLKPISYMQLSELHARGLESDTVLLSDDVRIQHKFRLKFCV